MAAVEAERWERLRQAQEKLVRRYSHHPDVSLIDIGYPPPESNLTEEVVLRMHLRAQWFAASSDERTNFPEKIDEIPVVLMRGDYDIEAEQ